MNSLFTLLSRISVPSPTPPISPAARRLACALLTAVLLAASFSAPVLAAEAALAPEAAAGQQGEAQTLPDAGKPEAPTLPEEETAALYKEVAEPTDSAAVEAVASDSAVERSKEGEKQGVKQNGQLRVEGIRLVNAAGQPIQLRGMSTHNIQWYPQFTGRLSVRELKKRGANLFRVAMGADSTNGGYNENLRTKGKNLFLLTIAVENSLAEDMYTIVDWHLLRDKNPLLTLESAKEFFRGVSQRYAENPAIIYEICNEPNGDTTWAEITRYAEEIIPVIRANSPQAVILVGTPKYSSDLASVRGAPLPFPNIMYSFHLYPRANDTRYAPLLEKMLQEGYPVFVTEWGIRQDEKSGELALQAGADFIAFMQRHGLSWANWSLSNKAESFSAIDSAVSKLSDWTEEDLTPSGKLVFRSFRD